MKRFEILDALRAVLALDVAVGHIGMFPLFGSVHQPDATLTLLARGWATLAFGPPAVIAFFIISGFCVHYPFAANGSNCAIGRFYARRYLRILIPVVCVVGLFEVALPKQTVIIGPNSIIWDSTLWSLVCEEIYYAVYPFISRLARCTGWLPLVVAACLPMALIMWSFFPAIDWNDVGILATTFTLFPVWLAGCYLAENLPGRDKTISASQIWTWRFAAWASMWLALVLHFHSEFHQTVTGPFLGLVYYFWLRAELSYYRDRKPAASLVWAGRWSYSLYLVHPLAFALAATFGHLDKALRLDWLVAFAAMLAGSYVFYLAIERPSHRLARRVPLLDVALPRSFGNVADAQTLPVGLKAGLAHPEAQS